MIPSANPTRNGFANPVINFVVAVFVLAVTAAVAALFAFAGSAGGSDWWWVAVGGLVVAYGQGAFSVVRFRRSRSEMVSHDEALFPVLLLVVGATGSILAWCLGVLLSNLMARRPPIKTLFNFGVFTLGSGLGAGVTLWLGGASVDRVGILATFAGTVVFAVSMSLVFSGLMARLDGERWSKAIAAQTQDAPKITLEILLGMLVAVAVKTTPVVTPLAIAALLAVTHAYRRWFRFDRDRKQLQDLLEVATGIQASTTVEGVESALTEAVYTLTAARSHVVHNAASSQNGHVLPMHLADGTTWALVVDRDHPLDSHDQSLVETLARIGSISFATAVLLEERQATAQRLETVVRSKEDFLLAVAHEIRTPLTAVNGFASFLSTSPPDPQLAGEAADHILEQSLEMTHLVDNLLVAARADSGETTLSPTMIDLRTELQPVVDSLPSNHRPNTAIAHQPCTSLADPIRVRQILRNLILNALHHGGDEITVIVGRTGQDVYVEVRDNGPGIAEADIESIFAPFEHRHRIPGRPGSLGLGLSVSRLLAERMGGDITHKQAHGHTVFALHLPAAPPTPQTHTAPALKLVQTHNQTESNR